MATILNNKSTFAGASKAQAAKRGVARAAVVVRAQKDTVDVTRRASLASIAGAAALLAGAAPSFAAYGDSANVFGRVTNTSGYLSYAGDGFAVNLPSKWNPSQEQDYPGTVLRYEDNGDTVNNFVIVANATDKKDISSYGPPEKFFDEISYLLGKQTYTGETISEGGFAPNRIGAASILDVGSTTDKQGKVYYTYELLTRTADGSEGGKHQLIKATVSQGKLWVLLVRIGDKRWFKGAKKEALTVTDSFIVA